MTAFQSGFFAVVGRPNVGKSSIVNTLVGQKVAIVTSKPQTTRNRILGVINGNNYQAVLVDTPGMQKPRTKLDESMEGAIVRALTDIDVVFCVVDASTGIGNRDLDALHRALQIEKPCYAVMNKMDIITEEMENKVTQTLTEIEKLSGIIKVSAKTGKGMEQLLYTIEQNVKEGPQYFPEDMLSDMPDEWLVGEIIREKMLIHLREEVPHGVGVQLEKFIQREDGVIEIGAVIFCERETQKGIIIGKRGSMLKKIGTDARHELEFIFDEKVFLQLFVKVQDKWRDNVRILKELGYE